MPCEKKVGTPPSLKRLCIFKVKTSFGFNFVPSTRDVALAQKGLFALFMIFLHLLHFPPFCLEFPNFLVATLTFQLFAVVNQNNKEQQ
jgi:hypothetical protein